MSAFAVIQSPTGNLRLEADFAALTHVSWTSKPTIAPDGDPIDVDLLKGAIDQVTLYFEDSTFKFDVKVAPKGNAFERAVWAAMCDIPAGRTASYGDLAGIVNRPARAVGGACGRNPIPIVIPCHRVIGADGRMTGFSGGEGIETKSWLLRHEGALLI